MAFQAPLTVAQVLQRYTRGPKSGLFTDGSAQPNPGPGGWGCVYVEDDEIIDQAHGNEPYTTNNRMELMGLIAAFKMASPSVDLEVYTDSQLCVNTITLWAASWEKRGWRRKRRRDQEPRAREGGLRFVARAPEPEAEVDSRPRRFEVERVR